MFQIQLLTLRPHLRLTLLSEDELLELESESESDDELPDIESNSDRSSNSRFKSRVNFIIILVYPLQ